jgi:hypothetical protein
MSPFRILYYLKKGTVAILPDVRRIGFKAKRTGRLREGHQRHCVGLKGVVRA